MKQILSLLITLYSLTAFGQQNTLKRQSDGVEVKPLGGISCSYALHREVDGKGRPASVVYGGITDVNGKTSTKLEAGRHDLTLSYTKIVEKIREKNKAAKESNIEITLALDPDTAGWTVNGKSGSSKITINRQSGIISINVPAGGGTIRGLLGYTIK